MAGKTRHCLADLGPPADESARVPLRHGLPIALAALPLVARILRRATALRHGNLALTVAGSGNAVASPGMTLAAPERVMKWPAAAWPLATGVIGLTAAPAVAPVAQKMAAAASPNSIRVLRLLTNALRSSTASLSPAFGSEEGARSGCRNNPDCRDVLTRTGRRKGVGRRTATGPAAGRRRPKASRTSCRGSRTSRGRARLCSAADRAAAGCPDTPPAGSASACRRRVR